MTTLHKTLTRGLTAALGSLALASLAFAAVPTPKEHFGFDIGDDYMLPTYTQTEAYFKKIADSTDRLQLVDIGESEQGRRQYMIIASSPENMAKLDHYKSISRRLARAEDLSEDEARKLADEGKAIVWIDGALHSTETVGFSQLIETIYQVASRTDAEMERFLKDTILLLVHCNPDGQELMADWYMREPVPEKRVMDRLPVLYHKYAGHDNNRDFYMGALKETVNLNRVLYLDWYPQIMFNHHQTSPTGTILVIPPYRDPVNFNLDPLVPMGLEGIGASMHNRFLVEEKPGVVNRDGTVFSIWWNGGGRTTPYFHNMLGVLTEIAGSPTPMEIALVPQRQISNTDLPLPIKPQLWHYRQSIEYSLTANWAVIDYASRHREQLLYNIYKMGRNSIERGSKDTWTINPHRVDEMTAKAAADKKAAAKADDEEDAAWASYMSQGIDKKYYAMLEQPEDRDPRGFIIPSDQPDFPRAIEFINALVKNGIQVERATASFTVQGKTYPAGSYVVKAAQAFRPHVMDMFEPQDHPNDFQYEGGPPIAPYDSAGWTLAFLMGVQFDRILEGFDGPFTKLPLGELQAAAPGKIVGTGSAYVVNGVTNRSFYIANQAMKAGLPVYRTTTEGLNAGPGSFFIPASPAATKLLTELAASQGVNIDAVNATPDDSMQRLSAPRIALWDTYGGSMPSGWMRLILENMGYDYKVVFAPEIDAGDLKSKFDVIILPTGAVPLPRDLVTSRGGSNRRRGGEPDLAKIPEEFHHMVGEVTEEKTIPALLAFVEAGGQIIAQGSSSVLAYHLDVPVEDHLVETVDGKTKPLSRKDYYVPGSVLEVAVDGSSPITWGMDKRLDVYFSDGRFDNAPVFKMSDDLAAKGVKPILWFDSAKPLKSGWAWGQENLEGGMLAAEAKVGEGSLTFFGTDITFRSQPHASFKLLFNSILQGAVQKEQ